MRKTNLYDVPQDNVLYGENKLQTGNWQPQRVLGCQFPPRNAKWLKNGKLRKAILSTIYNICNETLEYY
jgi:hypothetical protein